MSLTVLYRGRYPPSPPILIIAFRAFSLGAHFEAVCGRQSQM